jgi:hypothetical protein
MCEHSAPALRALLAHTQHPLLRHGLTQLLLLLLLGGPCLLQLL